MKTNSQKNPRNFKPVKISDTLGNFKKKMLYKFGELDYIINAKWSEIVGTFFINHSEPIKISSIPAEKNYAEEIVYDKYLHVHVSPSAALEFQHFQNKIIEKINSYFGYRAIVGIKIHQKFIDSKKINIKKKKNIASKNTESFYKLKKMTTKIKNKDLEESIIKLGRSIEENNK